MAINRFILLLAIVLVLATVIMARADQLDSDASFLGKVRSRFLRRAPDQPPVDPDDPGFVMQPDPPTNH